MILIGGYKSKEVAQQLGISPSAVSQRYRRMMDDVIIPYFKHNYESEVASTCQPAAMFEMAEANYGDFSPVNTSSSKPRIQYSRTYNPADMNTQRITPDFITQLGENEIFVFGSNLAGMHGGGAAYIAFKKFGARMGQGVGLQGQSYGIPTMQGGVETIAPYVDEFITFARQHPELRFLVTRIGCGIAGFTDADISPLFEQAHDVPNIVLPPGW